MERMTRSILRNKVAGPMNRRAVKGYLVHRCAILAFNSSFACGGQELNPLFIFWQISVAKLMSMASISCLAVRSRSDSCFTV